LESALGSFGYDTATRARAEIAEIGYNRRVPHMFAFMGDAHNAA
jgi:hypothetical protein